MKLLRTTALTAALMTAAVMSLTNPALAQGYNPPGPFTPAFGGTGSTYVPSHYSYGTGSSYAPSYNPPGPFTQAFGGTGYGYGYGTGYGAGYHPVVRRHIYATAAGVHHYRHH